MSIHDVPPRRTTVTAPELPDPMAPATPPATQPAAAPRRRSRGGPTQQLGVAVSPEHLERLDKMRDAQDTTRRALIEQWIDENWAKQDS